MVDYLVLRDNNFKKVKAVFANNYECSVGLTGSAANSIKFTLPLDGDIIPIGYFVTYVETLYGGRIESCDIDFAKKEVTYYGKSLTGILENYIGEWGTADRTIRIESEYVHPNCQHATSVAEYSTYPNNSPYGYCNYVCNKLGLPFKNTIVNAYPIGGYNVKSIIIPLGATFGQAISIMSTELFADYYCCKFSCNAEHIIEIAWTYGQTVLIDVSYVDEPVIVNKSLKPTAIIDHSTEHYIDKNGSYQSQSVDSVTDEDLLYPGINQQQIWQPNDLSNEKNRQNLRALRENNNGKISTTITRILNAGDKDDIDINDRVIVVHRQTDTRIESKLCEKIFTLKDGVAKVEYILG